jgi:hypothetical protein
MAQSATVKVFTTRPPRLLVATVVTEDRMSGFDNWVAALRAQETELLWDLVLVDGTDEPSPWYIRWLVAWSKSRPFGPRHRVRLLRAGATQGEGYRDEEIKARVARRLLWGKFENWASYDLLLSLEVELLIPVDTIQRLYRAGADVVTTVSARPLACAMVARRLVELVPLRLTSAPEDEQWLSDCRRAGVIPVAV